MAFHGLTKTPRVPQVYGERIFIPEPLSRTLVDVLSPYTAIYNTSHYTVPYWLICIYQCRPKYRTTSFHIALDICLLIHLISMCAYKRAHHHLRI